MIPEAFPQEIQPYLIPRPTGEMIYRCLGCSSEFDIEKLLYTCPRCGQVLLIHDRQFALRKQISGALWHQIFDYRRMLTLPALKGIYRFH
jgi:threonine synthase